MRKYNIIAVLTMTLILSGCSVQSAGNKAVEEGMAYLKNAQYEEAIPLFEAAISADKKLKTSYRGLGIAYLNTGEYDNAIKAFNQALGKSLGKIGDVEIDICYYKAVAQFKNKDMEGAIETYTSLIEYDKDKKEPYYLRATAYLNQEDLPKAQADFDLAISKDEDAYDIYIYIYENLFEHGYEEEGKQYLERALKRLQETEGNPLYTGRIQYYLQNYEEAKTELEKSIEAGDQEAYLYLGQIYDKLEDTETAQGYYSKYMEKVEKSTKAYNSLGESLLKDKNYSGALQMFQAGIALEDSEMDKKLRFNEMIAYEYLLDFDSAKEKLEKYLELYPDDEAALREYEFLKTR